MTVKAGLSCCLDQASPSLNLGARIEKGRDMLIGVQPLPSLLAGAYGVTDSQLGMACPGEKDIFCP